MTVFSPAVPCITDHATLRYLERGCGVDVEALREAMPDATDGDLLAHIAATTGLDVDAVREAIREWLSPAVRLSASAVFLSGLTWVLKRHHVVTCIRGRSRRRLEYGEALP